MAVLVDPGTTPAPEIQSAVHLLERRRAFIRVYEDRAANVRSVSEMLEHFPFDLLIIATHCGDSSGYRWTYQFTDSEGHPRTFVFDLAIGVARTDDPNVLRVGQFVRFISVDGVDWADRTAKSELYLGNSMQEFIEGLREGPDQLQPIRVKT